MIIVVLRTLRLLLFEFGKKTERNCGSVEKNRV